MTSHSENSHELVRWNKVVTQLPYDNCNHRIELFAARSNSPAPITPIKYKLADGGNVGFRHKNTVPKEAIIMVYQFGRLDKTKDSQKKAYCTDFL